MTEDTLMKAEYDDLMKIAKERRLIEYEVEIAMTKLEWIKKDIAARQNYFILCDDGTVELGKGCY